MNNDERFTFPGFESIRTDDSDTHLVDIGQITVNDETLVVHMIKKKNLQFKGDFLISTVMDAAEEECLWKFQYQHFEGAGLLVMAGDEVVIALVGKGRHGKVEKITPFSSFIEQRPIDLKKQVKLKRLAAEYLNRDYNLTGTERTVVKCENQRQKEAERAQQQQDREARMKKRQETRSRVQKRERVEVITDSGQPRSGSPVTNNEWESLHDGTLVVLVESLDDKTGEMGAPIEAFRVIKKPGKKPEKGSPAPCRLKPEVPIAVDEIAVEMKNNVFEVIVYKTIQDIDLAQKCGLKSCFATAEDTLSNGSYEVFSLHDSDVRREGSFEPISA